MNHPSHPSAVSRTGAIYAILAYLAWGLFPIYWKWFGSIPALEVLSHRVIWSVIFLTGLLVIQRQTAELGKLRRSPKTLGLLLLTSCLLACNWGLYIYGVNSDRVVETSLGYFINPLVSVLFGFLFLKERLQWGQQIAVGLATVGVACFVWRFGQVPWIALALAFSFASYGLLRKIIGVAPMVGLVVETALITPVALGLVSYWGLMGSGHFPGTGLMPLLFIGAGIVTSLPLLWFNHGMKRLPLSTMGFFQYIAPSMQLILGVFLYHEPFTPIHGLTFGLIWTALLIYSTTSLMAQRA